ncbi:MAG: hypothetical protein JNK82_01240 [Myxococcaceae bacterium]|nr:hypothetical protein [Myxococcaceae bacterium]
MLGVALALVVHAASPLSAAQSAFDRGEFRDALELLTPQLSSLPPGPELGRVHLLRAQCFHAMRQPAQVETALTLALMADPEARVDTDRVAPEIAQTLAALALRLSGRLTLAPKNLLPGDRVLIDSEPVATVPSARTVSIGRRTVTVQREGKTVLETQLLVRPGQEVTFDAEVPGRVEVVETPKLVEPQRPPVVEKRDDDERTPFSVMARLRIDPLRAGVSVDLGAEVTLGIARIALMASRGQFWGGALRPALVFSPHPRIGLGPFVELGLFFSSPVAVTLGGGGAVDVRLIGGLELFADVGGFFAPAVPVGVRSAYLLLAVGVRWRF